MARFSVSKTDKTRMAGYEIKLLKLQGHDRESVFPDSAASVDWRRFIVRGLRSSAFGSEFS